MTGLLLLVAAAGLTASGVLLAAALAKRRVAPQRRIPWIIALIVLGFDAALHVVAAVGMVVAGATDVVWLLLGTLGFVVIVAVAALRPRWAGWGLLASAALVPVVFAVGGLAAPDAPGPRETEGVPPWPVALVAYSVPAAASGGLLMLSTKARRHHAEGIDESVPQPTH
jgi:hypothetical protein